MCYPLVHKRTLHNHRVAIAERIFMEFGGTIKYGPFKDMILVDDISDLNPDFSSMFFGCYEQELLHKLVGTPKSFEYFINLGAGDGYYPIGAIKSGIFKKAIAYEASEFRRVQIKRLAEINNCHKNLDIRGFADETCFDGYDSEFLSKSLVLSDIEGGEFEIFSERNLAKLSKSIVIIEIHDFLVQDGPLKLEKLLENATKYFEITKWTTAGRNPSLYQELQSFTDVDRWLSVVEGRGPLMLWLFLSPKEVSDIDF